MWLGFDFHTRRHMWVGWVCCWFSSLLWEVFLRVLRFSPLLKNQHFQIPIPSGLLSSTLSWASGSGDCASTSRVVDIKCISLIYFLTFVYGHHVVVKADHKACDLFWQQRGVAAWDYTRQGIRVAPKRYAPPIPGHTQHLAEMMSRSELMVKEPPVNLNLPMQFNSRPCDKRGYRTSGRRPQRMKPYKMSTILEGWPENLSNIPLQVTPCYTMRVELSNYDGLVFKAGRLVVPRG